MGDVTLKAYLRGYRMAYRIPRDVETAPMPHSGYADAEMRTAFERGWKKGFEARRGDQLKFRQAQWYQTNKERIARKKRVRRRREQAARTLAVTSQILSAS